MKKNNSHKKALSIIEIMIGVFIFTLWISAIYMVISSTSRINTYNKNQIIASNLAREQIELIRNIRDTNYARLQKWNMLEPYTTNYNTTFNWWNDFYKLEIDSIANTDKILVSTGSEVLNFETKLKAPNTDTQKYRLCLNSENKYIYCIDTSWNVVPDGKETPFYRYIEIKQLYTDLTETTQVDNALKVRSRVFWNQKWIHSTEIPTILTDWKRL